jgi:hypothetical protein
MSARVGERSAHEVELTRADVREARGCDHQVGAAEPRARPAAVGRGERVQAAERALASQEVGVAWIPVVGLKTGRGPVASLEPERLLREASHREGRVVRLAVAPLETGR